MVMNKIILMMFAFFMLGALPLQLNGQEGEDQATTEEAVAQSEDVSPESGNEAAGKELFASLCKACHSVNSRLTGPPLAGVTGKRDKTWVHNFVRNSAEMIAAGDADAVAIFTEYNQVPMLAFPQLSDQEIDDIFTYIDAETERLKASSSQIKRPAENFPAYIPLSFNNGLGWSVIALINLMMVLGLMMFIRSQNTP
jgi:mono/diheme cytochrome c family protein